MIIKVTDMSRAQAFSDIGLGLALLALSVLLAAFTVQLVGLSVTQLPAVMMIQGLTLIIGLRALLAFRNQTWSHLLLHPLRFSDIGRGLLGMMACFGLNLVFSLGLYALDPDAMQAHMERLQQLAVLLTEDLPFALVAAIMLFVGVYEELLARGLLLDRSRILFGGRWWPVLISSVLFGLGHIYQGWIGVAQTTLVGMVLALLTLYWRSLWPAILAHGFLDTVSLGAARQLATGHL